MVRTQPPGPPPANYRPPGAAPSPPDGSAPLPSAREPAVAPPSSTGPATVATVGAILAVLGLIVGFVLGRETAPDRSSETGTAPTPTAPRDEPTTVDPRTPATDLDPTEIGTLDDPVPPGQAYILGLFELVVRGVDYDAAPELVQLDPTNTLPPGDERAVLATIEITFTDRTGFGDPRSLDIWFSDGLGRFETVFEPCGDIADPLSSLGPLGQGESAVANVCALVPRSVADDDLLLVTEAFAGPLYFALP